MRSMQERLDEFKLKEKEIDKAQEVCGKIKLWRIKKQTMKGRIKELQSLLSIEQSRNKETASFQRVESHREAEFRKEKLHDSKTCNIETDSY